jgi:hypothetical protein
MSAVRRAVPSKPQTHGTMQQYSCKLVPPSPGPVYVIRLDVSDIAVTMTKVARRRDSHRFDREVTPGRCNHSVPGTALVTEADRTIFMNFKIKITTVVALCDYCRLSFLVAMPTRMHADHSAATVYTISERTGSDSQY